MGDTAKTFALDQLGRAPLYALLIFALGYIHLENKATQENLVRVLETTLKSNTSAMDAVAKGVEEQTKTNIQMQQELTMHRFMKKDK